MTDTALGLYTVYSTMLYLASGRRGVAQPLRFLPAVLIRQFSGRMYWADVAWFTLLIALSSGTNSIFFFGFFFAILVASFRGISKKNPKKKTLLVPLLKAMSRVNQATSAQYIRPETA